MATHSSILAYKIPCTEEPGRLQSTGLQSTRDPPRNKGHIQTESEGLEKDIPCKQRQKKKAGVAILISDKIDFLLKNWV